MEECDNFSLPGEVQCVCTQSHERRQGTTVDDSLNVERKHSVEERQLAIFLMLKESIGIQESSTTLWTIGMCFIFFYITSPGFWLISGAVLLFVKMWRNATFSRDAWIGVCVSLSVVIFLSGLETIATTKLMGDNSEIANILTHLSCMQDSAGKMICKLK